MPLGFLTFRERDAVRRVVKGLLNKQVARELGTSKITVEIGQLMRTMEASFSSPIWSDLLKSLTRIAKTQGGSCESCTMQLRSSVLDEGAIVSFAKRLLRFHANFERIFERPKFRPSFHA